MIPSLCIANAAALAEATALTVTNGPAGFSSPAIAPVSLSIFRVVGVLALILGLFVGAAWLVRRLQGASVRSGRAPRVKVLEACPLGNRQTLYLVGCERQRMLIAASAAGVSLISQLPDADPESPADTPVGTSFTQSLRAALVRS